MKNIGNTTSIAILSSKGGTGKSQITLSLGYILAHCGFRTLLIDLDLFTHGLTFYSLGNSLSNRNNLLTGYLTGEYSAAEVNPIQVKHEFCRKMLYVLPNDTIKEKVNPEDFLNGSDIHSFTNKLVELTTHFKSQFQYILVDTRGGTDFTTVAASKSTDAHILITEADKPSWEMGRLLLKTIYPGHKSQSASLGFVINKNVLPSGDIALFLSNEWEMKHLASISMDPAAIKYFQEAKVPVAETLAIDFSFGILEIVQKTFFSGRWREENERVLHGLFEESSRLKVTMEKREQLREQMISFAFIFRSYAILFLLYLVFHFQTGGIDNYLVLMATILVLFSFLTDPYFLKLYKKGKERTGRVLKFKGKNAKPGVCIRSHR